MAWRPVAGVLVVMAITAPSADAYQVIGRKWPGQKISVRNATPYRFAAGEAMRLWNASGIRVRFVASRSRRADLIIRSRARHATAAFGGCAGYAQLGYVPGVQAAMVLAPGCGDDVLTAKSIAHELGHVLGLGHEDRRCALMNPTLYNGSARRCDAPDAQQGGVWRCRTIEPDDLAGARRLYGGRESARQNPNCPIFAVSSSPVAIQPIDDGGAWRLIVTTSAPPKRIVRISGAKPPDPVLLTATGPGMCPGADTPDTEPAAIIRQEFASWSSQNDVELPSALAPGHWCFAAWIEDPLGRRSPPAYTEIDVPQPPPEIG